MPTVGCKPNGFGFEQPHLGSTTGGIFGGSAGALPLGVRGDETNIAALNYDFPKPAGMGLPRHAHGLRSDLPERGGPVRVRLRLRVRQLLVRTAGRLPGDRVPVAAGLPDGRRRDALNPTAQFNPAGLLRRPLEPAGGAGADVGQMAPATTTTAPSAVEGGCTPGRGPPSRVFSLRSVGQRGRVLDHRGEDPPPTSQGPFNFILGANAYES
ncbi:MAG: hypothetical protein U5R48_19090 [Gammaproteobacteria bacterium]|nr:hypothetical protein [Gammaproteobacteria bacterium]